MSWFSIQFESNFLLAFEDEGHLFPVIFSHWPCIGKHWIKKKKKKRVEQGYLTQPEIGQGIQVRLSIEDVTWAWQKLARRKKIGEVWRRTFFFLLRAFFFFLVNFYWLMGFPASPDCKESACNAGDLGLIPESGKSPGEENGYPHQCSCLENSMDRGA